MIGSERCPDAMKLARTDKMLERLNRYDLEGKLSRRHHQAAREHHQPIGRGVTYVL